MIKPPKKKITFGTIGQKIRYRLLTTRMWNIQQDINDEWEIAKANGYTKYEFNRDDDIQDMWKKYKKLNIKLKEVLRIPKDL